MQGLAAHAGALLRFLAEERIEHCVLGDARDHPGAATGAIDLVVASAALSRMPGTLKAFCARNELELTYYQRARDRVEIYGLSWFGPEQRPEFLTLYIRTDYVRCGQVLFTVEDLLRDRLPASDVSGHGSGHYLAAPAKEFICHLLRCIDRRDISERDASHLNEQWLQDREGAAMQVDRFWNSAREGGVILRAAAAANWEPVRAAADALHAALHMRNVVPPTIWVREQIARARAWMHPTGLLIACLGPDGSGKSSLIHALCERPIKPFRHVHTMELRPRLMRPSLPKAQEGLGPYALKPRGRIGTLAKLLMFVADYWLGYWLRIRPKLVRATLVVSNRYFDDVLVDPLRYRMTRPRAFTRLLLRWIPRPQLWLVLDVPSEVLQTRQAEVPADEAARQRAEYRRVLRGSDNVVVLDASQPLEKVIAQAERAIVAELAQRTARQIGLPLDTMANPATTNLLLFFCRRDIPVLSRLVRVIYNSDIHCRLPPDVHLPHPYGIVIHPQAVIGHRVTVMQQASIGGKDLSESIAPIIGDDVYVGAGARILGDVRIGQGVIIGANAVVTRDIPPGVTVVGANRIVATARGVEPSDPSIAHFPVGAQRRTHTR